MHIKINRKYLTYNNFKVKCTIGKRGIGVKKKEGDLITPKGQFKIKAIYYRKDRIKTLPTKLKKIAINKRTGWCDDPHSKYYNKQIYSPSNFSYEKLYRADNIYDIILVLNFNSNPVKKNKGSAIFIHVARKDFSVTKGCVAIKKINLKKLVKIIDKKTLITIS